MKRILIIGAGRDQIPAIEIGKQMGCYVIASDMDPKAPGFRIADKSYVVSTRDYEGNLGIAMKEKIDGVLTLISETAVPVVGRICEELSLPGFNFDTAVAATNKQAMHRKMEAAGIPMPFSKTVSDINQAKELIREMNPPYVIKPSDSSGQRGVCLFQEISEVERIFNDAMQYSSDDRVLLEEYIQGPEINVTTVIVNGQVYVLSLSDRVTLSDAYFGIAKEHISPPDLDPDMYSKITQTAIRASEALHINNGITYPQLIASPSGPRLLEIAVRIPGGNMRELVYYTSGIDLVEVAIKQALGEEINLIDRSLCYPSVYIKFFTELDISNDLQTFNELKGVDDAKKINGVKEIHCFLNKGDSIPRLDWSGGRFASIVIASETRQKCFEIAEEATRILRFI